MYIFLKNVEENLHLPTWFAIFQIFFPFIYNVKVDQFVIFLIVLVLGWFLK